VLPRYINTPINCSDFILNDWLDYSYDNCIRSIPNVNDGLKPSQRKVLFVMLNSYKPAISNSEEHIERFKKVFQICGEVASKAYYHHGDQSLNETIIKMNQDFVGSNNLPLLAYCGSFGSRDMNGDDAGAPRYISSTIHEVARLIFPKDDDDLLISKYEDNNKVEPLFYIPIIPMILINGTKGIGTGYSTTVMQHSALTMIKVTRIFMKTKTENKIPKFYPHYEGYKGKIYLYNDYYIIEGSFTVDKSRKVLHITEIPFVFSKQKFIQNLQELYEENIITNWIDKSKSTNDFDFYISFSNIIDIDSDKFKNKLLLRTTISITNMNLFNTKTTLTHYEKTSDIFREWFSTRESYYDKRRDLTIKNYENKLNELKNKMRFVKGVIDNEIKINKRERADIVEELKQKSFFNIDMLLSIPIVTLTKEEYEKLVQKVNDLNNEYEEYKKLTIYDIWNKELDILENYLKK